ncbi:MAG TPA: DeoR/GlpR family DNA-binding transcription regulator, partial [Caulobacteraceae bacterium]|nr:DeoR/GlpR family DNA-binding transcription regulator [Caulobacteraceae bacterium]
DLIGRDGFTSFKALERLVEASPATIRRDLERLAGQGRLSRLRGGARLAEPPRGHTHLGGVPFHENIGRNPKAKSAIGRAAAGLCAPGEAVMIDGGSTTLQMCPHLAGLDLQVLTNSLHIVSALLPKPDTRILAPAGTVFRDQNIILSAECEDGMPCFHAPKLFMGAAAVGRRGVMRADILLVAVERRLIERADEIILLVDSSKFSLSSGHVVCGLESLETVVTDSGLTEADRELLTSAEIRVVIAD